MVASAAAFIASHDTNLPGDLQWHSATHYVISMTASMGTPLAGPEFSSDMWRDCPVYWLKAKSWCGRWLAIKLINRGCVILRL